MDAVSVGETAVEPLRATLPIPGSMTQVSEFVEVQVRVDDSPERMVSGSALIVRIGAG